jgi:hypothetical protein
MTQAANSLTKIPTRSPQPSRGKAVRAAAGKILGSGTGRAATRGGGEVIELEHGITVYPAREDRGRWRAVWHEGGERQQCEAVSEERLAAKLEKVPERFSVLSTCCRKRA